MLIWKEQTFNTVPFIILLNQTGFGRSKNIFFVDDEKLLKQRFFSQKERIDHSKNMFKRLQYFFLILSDLFAGLHAWFVKEVSVVTLKTAKLCKFYIWRTLLKKSHTRAARPTDGRNRVEGEREDQSWRFSWKDFARDQSRDWESFIFAEPRSQDRSLCNSVKMVPGGQSEFNLLLGTPGPESPGSGWGIIVATDWS